MAIRIAIVEDEDYQAQTLQRYLERFSSENRVDFTIRRFAEAVSLLDNYSPDYDLIYMDIRMPYMNGMDAAHRLRALDQDVLLVFVTTLTQYAIQGYEVEALDYIVKPINYYDFALKLTRALKKLPQEAAEGMLLVGSENGTIRINPRSVRYVEVTGHQVVYHTLNGDVQQYGSLSQVEKELDATQFVRCNSCFLVNMQYVRGIKGYTLQLDDDELKISQPKKKRFMEAWEAWLKSNGKA